MTKQNSHPQRQHRRNLWIAMLATLAFAGGGQALAPAPAAALHIEACAQPEFGLCDAAEEGPTSGDSSSGDSKGGGGFGSSASSPDPGTAAWNQREPNGVPTWMVDSRVRYKAFRAHCGKISDRARSVEEELDVLNSDLPSDIRRRAEAGVKVQVEEPKLKRQLRALDHQWDSFNCEALGFSDLGL